jgi:hypothetical protein
MTSFLTIEQKRQILTKHYRALNVELNPCLPDSEIEKYYKKLLALDNSEKRHRFETEKPKLRLIKIQEDS